MLTISERAFDLIVREECSDERYYNARCKGFEWPGGASGPTVGIGFDCGYVTHDEIVAAWHNIVPDDIITILLKAQALKANAARSWVAVHKHSIEIPWMVALQQFRERELPKWIKTTSDTLPNCDKLSPDSFGALVSLAYNRGPSFRKTGARYAEMRNIFAHMQAQHFEKIPGELMAMRRLWAADNGVYKRRQHEADLFRAGLVAATV